MMASNLVFYTNPMSRGRVIRWMLEETGADYETVVLDYASTMKQEPYLSINPMGKVPAIVHNGHVVTECAAICAYLADAFPEAGLAPPTTDRADYYRWLFYAAGPLEQAVTNNYAKFEPAPEQGRMFGYGSYDTAVSVVDGLFTSRDYVCGDRFTAADVYVGSAILWGTQFGTLPKLDSFVAYAERLSVRDAYRRGKEMDNQLIAEIQAAG